MNETMENNDGLPPFSNDAERGVLGCILNQPGESLDQCIAAFRQFGRFVFYDLRHQELYNFVLELRESKFGGQIDLVTIADGLTRRGLLEQLGGIPWLAALQDGIPSVANLPAYLEIVREKHLQRLLLQACARVSARVNCFEGGKGITVSDLLTEVESEFSKLGEFAAGDVEEKHIKDVIAGVMADMEQWHYSRGSLQLRGLPTGPKGNYLDKVLLGIRPEHYVVIAGRPGDGKSSMAMNIVEFLAREYVWFRTTGKQVLNAEGVTVQETERMKGIPIAVFTIEMDNESLGYRMLFGRAGVDEAEWNQGFKKDGDDDRLKKAALDLAACNIYLDDTPAQSIGQIAAKARRMAKQYGIKLFVLDYLQLCTSDNPRDDERIRLDKISKKIMALKKQLKVPWLVLAQMNRNIETADRDRSPVLSDLAGSGSIEQDSDKVIILKKPARRNLEKPNKVGDKEGPSDLQLIDIVANKYGWAWSRRPTRIDAWVVKNRRGPRGKAEMLFQNNLCKFEDWHMWKVLHELEERKEGESKHLGTEDLPSNDELNE